MKRTFLAKEILRLAGALVGDDYQYRYDEKHESPPSGPGWEKTDSGWRKGQTDKGDKAVLTQEPEKKTEQKPVEQKPAQKPIEQKTVEKKPVEQSEDKIEKLKNNPPKDLETPEQQQDYHARVSEYKTEIVGDNLEEAQKVAAALSRGISDNADICKINPSVCQGNLGITRSNMPQLHDKNIPDMEADAKKDEDFANSLAKKAESSTDENEKKELLGKAKKAKAGAADTRNKIKAAVDSGVDPNDKRSTTEQFLDTLEKDGVKITGRKGDYEKVPVGKLRATQREIQAKKTMQMADSYFSGRKNFKPNQTSIIVSTEEDGSHCILDGHHRWSSALVADPEMEMNCISVNMPIKDMLKKSLSMPGVYRADLQGKIVDKNTPLDLDGWKEGEERAVKEARQKRESSRENRMVSSLLLKLARELAE